MSSKRAKYRDVTLGDAALQILARLRCDEMDGYVFHTRTCIVEVIKILSQERIANCQDFQRHACDCTRARASLRGAREDSAMHLYSVTYPLHMNGVQVWISY